MYNVYTLISPKIVFIIFNNGKLAEIYIPTKSKHDDVMSGNMII